MDRRLTARQVYMRRVTLDRRHVPQNVASKNVLTRFIEHEAAGILNSWRQMEDMSELSTSRNV